MSAKKFVILKNVDALMNFTTKIQELADSQRHALGFLPETAFRDAIVRKRLFAMIACAGENEELAGYLLYSGVFPNAKVQQIAVSPNHRSAGVASALMNTLVADLENRGFMAIRADVASDLQEARLFYSKNGFDIIKERAGGQTRGRKILLHVRELETDSLFSLAKRTLHQGLDLGIRRRSAGNCPLYAFDLNVFFDLVKERQHSQQARRLFSSALGHDLRLVVADEFAKELAKRSKDVKDDPILQMALSLPRLPAVPSDPRDVLAGQIHDLVFVKRGHRDANSAQAFSDAQHLSHAALARVSAFITRDGALINARDELLADVGIDVISLDELIGLLPADPTPPPHSPISGQGFSVGTSSSDEMRQYLSGIGASGPQIDEACSSLKGDEKIRHLKVSEHGAVVAVGSMRVSRSMEPIGQLLVHVRPEHPDSGLFADYLFDILVRDACENSPITLVLEHFPGQTIVNRVARSRGFVSGGPTKKLTKAAFGKPLTEENWRRAAQELRRRTGLAIPSIMPPNIRRDGATISDLNGKSFEISVQELENLISPTLFIWPGRSGVIVPITKAYADELLGTSRQQQFTFLENRDAAFLSKRAYVNSPKSAKLMRPDMPILFYESKRDGKGRGAVVAAGRIVDAIISKKGEISNDGMRRLVVEDVDSFSKTDDVLLTSFDNLMAFPNPVPVKKLKELDAMGRANLVSPVALDSQKIAKIFAEGWPVAR